MGKSLAEVHALERARWDALVPTHFDPSNHGSRTGHHLSPARHLLTDVSDFLGDLHGRRVVEYGCGLGDLTLRLAREGAHVTAVDLSPRSIGYARERARAAGLADRIEAHVAPAERLPFFDESFDLAFGRAVLHCVVAELGASELHRVLRPGGRAVFFEPIPGGGPIDRLGGRSSDRRARRRAEHELRRPELEPWRRGFQTAELRCLRLPLASEPGSVAGGWRRAPVRWLGRLAPRRPAYAVLLLTR